MDQLRPHEITNILMKHFEDGVSVNIYGVKPIDGYVVGGEVPGLVLKPWHPAPYLSIDQWLAEHWDRLENGRTASIWTDSETGITYVDISRNVTDLYSALAIASARGEIAVWDVASAKEVRTEEEN